jgi:hypothetical protein
MHAERFALRFWSAGVLVTLALVFRGTAEGGPINTFPNLVEVMMEAQNADAAHIGSLLGPDNSSTLEYSASLNPDLLTFSYSLASGSMYLGLPIAQTTVGLYNSSTGLWDIASTGSYDGISWSGTADALVTGDPLLDLSIPFGLYTIKLRAEWNYPPTGTGLATSVAGITITKGGALVGTLNTADESEVIGGVFGPFRITTTNTLFAPGNKPFEIKIQADPIAPGGGQVNIAQNLTSVPEPPLAVLNVIGLFFGTLVWRHHKRD